MIKETLKGWQVEFSGLKILDLSPGLLLVLIFYSLTLGPFNTDREFHLSHGQVLLYVIKELLEGERAHPEVLSIYFQVQMS